MANVTTAKRLDTKHSDAQTVIQVDMKSLSDWRNRMSTPHLKAQIGAVDSLLLVVATSLSWHDRLLLTFAEEVCLRGGSVARCPAPPPRNGSPRNASSSLAQPGLLGSCVPAIPGCSISTCCPSTSGGGSMHRLLRSLRSGSWEQSSTAGQRKLNRSRTGSQRRRTSRHMDRQAGITMASSTWTVHIGAYSEHRKNLSSGEHPNCTSGTNSCTYSNDRLHSHIISP